MLVNVLQVLRVQHCEQIAETLNARLKVKEVSKVKREGICGSHEAFNTD